MTSRPPEKEQHLAPRLLQICGILLLVGSAVFWAVSDRESPLLIGSAMTLIGAGSYSGIVLSLKKSTREDE